MNNRKGKALASTFFLLSLASGLAYAQQTYPPKSESSPSPTNSSNSLTGGAEGTTTDKGTPGAMRMDEKRQNSSSGSSGSSNTFTGGAEASPTDQGTGSQSDVNRLNDPASAGGSSPSLPQPSEK